MADRFPALEEYENADVPTKQIGDGFGSDSAPDDNFLTRERAAFGDDATQFASGHDKSIVGQDGEHDLLGGDAPAGSQDDFVDFQSSFPDIKDENAGPATAITGGNHSSYVPHSDDPEPEVITQWRERRDLALQDRAEKSERKKAETIKTAQQNIDDFYENYNSKKDKTIAQTQHEADTFLSQRQDTSAGGTSWERIAKLVDLSGKGTKGGASGTGKERFREMLLNLKKDEKAPGATGY